MGAISENPVLNQEAAAKLRFQEIAPEVPARTIPELPPPDPEDSSEASDNFPESELPEPVGRHRKPSSDPTTPPRPRGRPRKTPESGSSTTVGADKPAPPPKIKAPDFREWHDFGTNFFFKWICRGYVAYAFKGIDRERVLNTAELKAIEPDEEMLSSATKPLAHMADRSKFMTKHGRAIVDSAEGIEALIAVGMWMNTINRIARSHEHERAAKPSTGKQQKVNVRIKSESVREQSSGSNVEEESRPIRVVSNGFGGPGMGVGG